jgi:hypothetical protein
MPSDTDLLYLRTSSSSNDISDSIPFWSSDGGKTYHCVFWNVSFDGEVTTKTLTNNSQFPTFNNGEYVEVTYGQLKTLFTTPTAQTVNVNGNPVTNYINPLNLEVIITFWPWFKWTTLSPNNKWFWPWKLLYDEIFSWNVGSGWRYSIGDAWRKLLDLTDIIEVKLILPARVNLNLKYLSLM